MRQTHSLYATTDELRTFRVMAGMSWDTAIAEWYALDNPRHFHEHHDAWTIGGVRVRHFEIRSDADPDARYAEATPLGRLGYMYPEEVELSLRYGQHAHETRTKRGERGRVYRGHRLIGHAFAHAKVAAGTGGQRRPFFTAEAIREHDGRAIRAGHSLGTRWTTRELAAQAIADFDSAYPPPVLAQMARSRQPLPYRTAYERALTDAAGAWKQRNPAR